MNKKQNHTETAVTAASEAYDLKVAVESLARIPTSRASSTR